jgi:hypothetical protein
MVHSEMWKMYYEAVYPAAQHRSEKIQEDNYEQSE